MDEKNRSSKAKRIRVLRAMDVMPPFDKSTPSSDPGATDVPRPPVPSSRVGGNEEGLGESVSPGVIGPTARPLSRDGAGIPIYDLAENILAEQRRAAGRRRRGPGRAEEEPVAVSGDASVSVSAPDWAPGDLPELQRLVAEIVARDIERLCRRPERPAQVPWYALAGGGGAVPERTGLAQCQKADAGPLRDAIAQRLGRPAHLPY